jgi:hypothetical protein
MTNIIFTTNNQIDGSMKRETSANLAIRRTTQRISVIKHIIHKAIR